MFDIFIDTNEIIKPAAAKRVVYNNTSTPVIPLDDYINMRSISDCLIEDGNYFYEKKKPSLYNKDTPGLYDAELFIVKVEPSTEEDKVIYSSSNIIDFNDAENIKQLIMANNKLKEMEAKALAIIDGDITPITMSGKESAELKALKEALILKNINIDSYAGRFGANWPNDRRIILSGNDITNKKLKTICPNFDLKVSIIIDNASPDVPNPIPHPITIDVVGGE